MSVSWSTGLPATDPAPGTLILRRIARWLRRWFYRGEHNRPLDIDGQPGTRHHIQLPVRLSRCGQCGRLACSWCYEIHCDCQPAPWPTPAEYERIWPELDLLSVERFIDRLFAPLETAR